ncbi:hypothetical protein ACFL6X_00440 [Candidatus Latescibacterota bacterium]
MNGGGPSIRSLREILVRARRERSSDLLDEVIVGLRQLGDEGYRCCLVDFGSCRPAFYVRVLGFESPRVTAELEFPIEPRLKALQKVPLSHLADYDEAADPGHLQRVYDDMAEFLHAKAAPLDVEVVAPRRLARRNGRQRRPHSRRPGRKHSGLRPLRRVMLAAGVWWGIAGVLLTSSLFLFLHL